MQPIMHKIVDGLDRGLKGYLIAMYLKTVENANIIMKNEKWGILINSHTQFLQLCMFVCFAAPSQNSNDYFFLLSLH